MTIYFYVPGDEYGAFSNFSAFGVEIDDLWWPTVEHYFQACKFEDADYRERIRKARPAKAAKDLGQSRKLPLRPDWDQVKERVMKRALEVKFATHAEPRALLLASGDQTLVENAPSDYYWGCGADGSGLNRLGLLLMEVRSQLVTNGEEQDG